MRKVFFLLLTTLVPFVLFAQESITISFDNGEKLLAENAYISNFSSNSLPYILLNKKEGPYYSINEIESLQGTDKKGRERLVVPVEYKGKSVFAQLLFQSEKVSIYYSGVTDFSANFDQVNTHYRYSFSNANLKVINIKNLQSDLQDNEISMEYLRKAKKVRNIQTTLYAIGAGLLAHGLLSMTDQMERTALYNQSTSIPATFLAGAVVVNIPWFLKSSKRKYMINSLKTY